MSSDIQQVQAGEAEAAHSSDHHEIHLPGPSWAPILLSMSLIVFAIGLLIFLRQVAVMAAGGQMDAFPTLLGGGIILLGGAGILTNLFNMIQPEAITAEPHVASIGVDNRLLGMWVYLATEIMFFTGLLATFLGYRERARAMGIIPELNVPLMTIATFVLLASSFAMVMSLSNIQKGKMPAFRGWMTLTLALGVIFLGIEFTEWAELASHGTTLGDLFGTAIYTLTGFHATHVLIGLIWIGAILFSNWRGKLSANSAQGIEIFGLYWHFVDIVWIVLFTVIYLIG